MQITIDRDRSESLPEQIARQIRERIADGTLPVGARLPSSRELARSIGVGRNAVVAAYEILVAAELVDSTTGRGTFISDRSPALSAGPSTGARSAARSTRREVRSPFSWAGAVARECPPLPAAGLVPPSGAGSGSVINFAGAVPDPATFPTDKIRRVFHDVLRREGAEALGYGPTAGYLPLREFIAARAREDGAPVTADDVLIVGGSQQGLDLVARLMLAPGDGVVVEAPTYSNALQIWQLYGADVVGVSMDARGMIPEMLRSVLGRTRPKFVYVMPTFQNPTGLSMDRERRGEIMAVVEEFGVPVLEDHFDTDLRYAGAPLPPLQALDSNGQVLLLGTFSKILFPGFRLGWIIASPEVRRRLLDIKRTCDLATSLPAQMAVAEFCARGELDRHLDRVRRHHAARLTAMQDAITRHFPPSASVTCPEGGMTLWVTLPENADSERILADCRRRDVVFAPGTWFFPDGSGRRHIRLSFIIEPAERIQRGIAIMGEELRRHLAGSAPPTRREEEPAPFL